MDRPGIPAAMELAAGWLAGVGATTAISALEVMKDRMAVMPELDQLGALSKMLGAPESRAAGWLGHYAVGTFVYGSLYAVLDRSLLGGQPWQRGLAFGGGAWLLAMTTFMPGAGAGPFGARLGASAPLATLVLHLIFGAALATGYHALTSKGGLLRAGAVT